MWSRSFRDGAVVTAISSPRELISAEIIPIFLLSFYNCFLSIFSVWKMCWRLVASVQDGLSDACLPVATPRVSLSDQ